MVKSDVLCLICVKFRELYLPPDGFFGFRISLNSISIGRGSGAAAQDRQSAGREEYPLPIPHSPRRLQSLDVDAFGV